MAFEAWYSREGTPGWQLHSWDDANHLLSYLKPDGQSFAAFTLSDGSYVQCAGRKTRLTVEARVVASRAKFRHYVFGKGAPTGETESIACAIGPIEVDRTQLLAMRDARLLIREFVERRRLHDSYYAQDVTLRFAQSSS